jgi:hypothetical protein
VIKKRSFLLVSLLLMTFLLLGQEVISTPSTVSQVNYTELSWTVSHQTPPVGGHENLRYYQIWEIEDPIPLSVNAKRLDLVFAEPSFPDYDREIVVRPILETIWGISVKLPEQTALSSYDQLSWYVPTFLQPSRQDFSQNLKPRLLGFTMLSDKPLPDLPIQSILSTESAASNWVDIDHVSLHQSGGVAVRVDDENTYPLIFLPHAQSTMPSRTPAGILIRRWPCSPASPRL